MIVVTGATCNYARQVVDGLLKKLPATKIGVSTRNASKAADLQQRGVRVCQADFADPASLRQAFDGAEQVLIVSGTSLDSEGPRQHGNAIHAAKDAGVKRLLYTSHHRESASPIFAPIRLNHAPTETLLAACGVPYVSLQNGFYAESALFQLKGVQETGEIRLPQDGPVNWTARADLAEAAVALLLDPGLLNDGISPPLTGSDLLDFNDIAATLSQLLGRPIKREVIRDDAYRASLVQHGTPEQYADLLLTLYTASRTGEFAALDPTLHRLIGKEPASMRSVLEAYLNNSARPNFQQS